MSTGSLKVAGSIDLEESNPENAPAGVSRLFRKNGLIQISADALSPGALIGGLPIQRLLDANTTIAIADGKSLYYYPAGILTANRTITISAAGPPANGWSAIIAVLGVQGFDLLIRDDAATLIHTISAGQKAAMTSYFSTSSGHAVNNGWYFLP